MKSAGTKSAVILNFLKFYNLLWRLCLPFLKRNKRLAPGFSQRTDPSGLPQADIWIQAASAGEAYLAVRLVRQFGVQTRLRVLVTTITTQGMDILHKGLNQNTRGLNSNLNLTLSWFPFDRPDIMENAVRRVQPKVMVLLETELWPSLLHYLKSHGCRTAVVNARMSKNSFQGYMKSRFLWKHLVPDCILATSDRDRIRYEHLFPEADVRTMSNMKFDMMVTEENAGGQTDSVEQYFDKDMPLTILASVRKQEEKDALQIIQTLLAEVPNQALAVFPRHIHRITAWEKLLKKSGINYQMRSRLKEAVNGPAVLLWDTFGELQAAYRLAQAVFVGGSLKPLGGQNFIEPALQGTPTVIGPHYDDFAWVSEEIFTLGLVTRRNTPQEVAQSLIHLLRHPVSREPQIRTAREYIRSRQGGTQDAGTRIMELLDSGSPC